MQTSWTAIFGAVAALESIILAWGAQKFYHAWSRLFAAIVAIKWPCQVQVVQEEKVEADAIPVAPKRVRVGRRQPAINARDDCYKSIDALAKGLKRKISCKVLCVQGLLNSTHRHTSY